MRQLTTFFSLFFLTSFSQLAADEGAIESPQQGLLHTFTLIAIALGFFYFILWRPEQKKRKALEETRGAMQKGDKVTAMGIIGTVVRVEENTVVLKMIDGSQIEFIKAAVTEVMQTKKKDS